MKNKNLLIKWLNKVALSLTDRIVPRPGRSTVVLTLVKNSTTVFVKTATVITLSWFNFSVHAANHLPTSVVSELNRLNVTTDSLSVYAKDLTSGNDVLNWNGERPGNPASSIKVMTTFAGLDILGPNYRWPTEFYYNGSISNGVLNGDLIIKGYGDPFFVNESLEASVAVLRQKFRHINGRLLVDNTYFKLPDNYPDSLDGARTQPYNAIPDAMNMNFGTSKVTIIPQKNTNYAAIEIDPPVITRKIVNQTRQNKNKCQWFAPSYENMDIHQLTIRATLSSYCKPSSDYYVIVKPYEIVSGAFKKLWLQQNGTLSESYGAAVAKTPASAQLIWRNMSKPLFEQIKDMNKLSNNVMTRQLFLTLGAAKQNIPGTLDKSRDVIYQWLKENNISTNNLYIDNGSGLSRSTRMTPKQLVEVVERAAKHKYANEFIESLAIAGVDGTMRKRFRDHPAKGNIYVKTGTLRDVRTMVALVYSKSGKLYAVSTVHEFPGIQNQKGTLVQNKILDWLYYL